MRFCGFGTVGGEHIATADWTPGHTEKAAAAIADKIISDKKLKAYIKKRPNGETTLYLAQLENKTDRSDMDSARVTLNAALKEKLLNEAEGFNVIDQENKAVAKEMARTRGSSVRIQDVIQAAQKLRLTRRLPALSRVTDMMSAIRLTKNTLSIYKFWKRKRQKFSAALTTLSRNSKKQLKSNGKKPKRLRNRSLFYSYFPACNKFDTSPIHSETQTVIYGIFNAIIC